MEDAYHHVHENAGVTHHDVAEPSPAMQHPGEHVDADASTAATAAAAIDATQASTLQPWQQRRGKWHPEEEAYIDRIIVEFRAGLLPLEDGTTLRDFLSKLLKCDPMRITKKFEGGNKLRKQTFRASHHNADEAALHQMRMELQVLESKFMERLERSQSNSPQAVADRALAEERRAQGCDLVDLYKKCLLEHPDGFGERGSSKRVKLESAVGAGDRGSSADAEALIGNNNGMMDPMQQIYHLQQLLHQLQHTSTPDTNLIDMEYQLGEMRQKNDERLDHQEELVRGVREDYDALGRQLVEMRAEIDSKYGRKEQQQQEEEEQKMEEAAAYGDKEEDGKEDKDELLMV
eukprot:g14904.t1 g14904   contig21:122116-123241(-)